MRSVAEIEAQVQRTEEEIRQLVPLMEEQATAFRQAAVSFARDWMRQTVEASVQANHERARKVEEQTLRSLKARLSEELDNAASNVEGILGDESLWSHRAVTDVRKVGERFRYGPGSTGLHSAREISEAVRRVISFIGVPLVESGFAETDRGATGRSDWRVNERGGPPRLLYSFGFEESPEMRSALHGYAKLHHQLASACDQLAKLVDEKNRVEAKNLWDSL